MTITADISTTTRKIKFDKIRPFAVDGDYNIDEIIFKLPTDYEENIDFVNANKIIYYTAVNRMAYNVPLTDTDSDGNPIWHCSAAVTDAGDGNITFVLVFSETNDGVVGKRWVSMPCTLMINGRDGVEIESEEEEQGETTYAQRLITLMTQVSNLQSTVNGLASGAPTPESLVANMQEGHIYVYTGTEPGYTTGHWYYYNGSTWADGGAYGAYGLNVVDDGDGNITLTAGGTA